MNDTWLTWFSDFFKGLKEASEWLLSTPFKDIAGIPETIKNLTPLALIGIGGLLVFIIAAIIKWLIS